MDVQNLQHAIEVLLKKDPKIIKETLERIGIANKKQKIVYPSCYLYQKNQKYYILHFKELFLISRENSYNNLSEEDVNRKKATIFCLKNWGLVDVEEEKITPHNCTVFVLPHKDKQEWLIKHKIKTRYINGVV